MYIKRIQNPLFTDTRTLSIKTQQYVGNIQSLNYITLLPLHPYLLPETIIFKHHSGCHVFEFKVNAKVFKYQKITIRIKLINKRNCYD